MRHRYSAVLLIALLAVGALPTLAQELVIVRDGSKEYHRPGCELIQGRTDVLAMQRGQAEARGYKAHGACDPANTPAPSRPKPVMVTIDDSGKYYHRDDCKKIGKRPRKVTVEEASKKHWPCPTCKPPIRPRRGPAEFEDVSRDPLSGIDRRGTSARAW